MATQVYGIGYSGRTPDEIKALAEALDATVFDVRFSPRSRVPHWSGKRLSALLGTRYQHVRAFGNANYKGGPIAIVDFEAGLRLILESPKSVILMCVCKNPAICHRTTIGSKLSGAGFQFTELNGPGAQMNPTARRARQIAMDL